jgi:hypothetical protein
VTGQRRRLTAGERRVVDPVIAAAANEVNPVVAAAGKAVADHFAALPVELRQEALIRLMNTIGGALFNAAQTGLEQLEVDDAGPFAPFEHRGPGGADIT